MDTKAIEDGVYRSDFDANEIGQVRALGLK
jgi:hypothetical protein